MRALIALIAAIWPSLAAAQTDDRDYLTALLEDNLSGAGRSVVITGFAGALSSQARLDRMTIADDEGIWITLTDVVLDWQRSDLLAGRITVSKLTAAEIDIARLPQSEAEIAVEAAPFALPELPVAVSIGEISVGLLRLGAPVLGEVVTATGTASLQLVGGEGQGQLRIERLDTGAPTARADIAVSYANAARLLDLDINIVEGMDGLLATALGIPGRPAIAFSAKGAGPLDDLTAQIALRSDDMPRLAGAVRLKGQNPETGQGTAFDLDLSGDVSAFLQPDYRPFFGPNTTLRAAGSSRLGGGFDLDDLTLSAQSVQLAGSISMGANGVPQRFALSGRVQDPSGAPVRLPLALDSPAALSSATITAQFDAAIGDTWQAGISMAQWMQGDLRIAAADLRATGTLRSGEGGTTFDGDLALNAEGIAPARVATSRAIGSVVWGNGRLAWTSGQGPLSLSQFTIAGDDYQIGLDGTLHGLADGLSFVGNVSAKAADLGRFADLLGQPLAGAGEVGFTGQAVLLTGAFDGAVQAKTSDLAFGIPAVDAMLRGEAILRADAQRGAAGVTIRAAELAARGGTLALAGRVAGAKTDVAGQFHLLDLPMADRGFAGQVKGDVALTGPLRDAALTLRATSSGLDLGIDTLRPLLASDAQLAADVALVNFVPRLQALRLTSPLMTADLMQEGTTNSYRLIAALGDLGVVAPQFPGALRLSGTIAPQGNSAEMALTVTGPAGLSAQIDGTASAGADNDLRLTGRADAGLVNAFIAPRSISGLATFNLALRGASGLGALTGEVSLQSGQMADPNLPFTLRKIAGRAALAGGQIAIDLAAEASGGGAVTLAGNMSAVGQADLGIALRGLVLRNSDLIDTSISGDLRYAGRLGAGGSLSGRIDMARTEVQLRPTELPATDDLPSLRHTGDALPVQQTRARAGRGAGAPAAAEAATGAPIALDIMVRAANRVFVRGRGLDAELGGQVRLQGTSTDVRPSGAFDLVQGRFEILTKRLTLEEVRLEMQGQLIPFLYVRAVNTRGSVTTTVVIDGPAIDPEFRFSASPEMPEEEVLAQLLFDQNLTRLSALQGAQLAGAVAALTGRGEGLLARTRKALRLDDLDVQTTTSGAAALKLGKYVSDNVYSEVTVEGASKQGLDFTYSLNEKIKLRAGAQTTGNTSLGIEFETNY